MDGTQPQAAVDVPPAPAPVIPTQAVVQQTPQPQLMLQAQPTPTQVVGEVVQAGAMLPPAPQQQPIPSIPVGVAQKEQMVAPTLPETAPLIEIREEEKIPEDVEGWLEKLEQAGEIKIPEPIKKDEQILLDNATPTKVQDVVVLPLSQQSAAAAAQKKSGDSARWLYEWCKRLLLMLGNRAKYRE